MMKKSLIICAAVFMLGAILTIGGYISGGMKGFEKAAKNHGWAGDGAVVSAATQNRYNFSSIEARGAYDLVLASNKYYKDALTYPELTGKDIRII